MGVGEGEDEIIDAGVVEAAVVGLGELLGTGVAVGEGELLGAAVGEGDGESDAASKGDGPANNDGEGDGSEVAVGEVIVEEGGGEAFGEAVASARTSI